jgi:exopolysaccharide biosynthesis polyprenyl glycosylphosphotransferase
MAHLFQPVIDWLSFATGVSRPAPEIVIEPPRVTPALKSVRKGGAGAHHSENRRARAERKKWLSVIYVAIDIALICANAITVLWLRFTPVAGEPVTNFWLLRFPAYLPMRQYGGFLLLYIPLIVLFCQVGNLYRPVRNRSFESEARDTAVAVGYATLLLTAFIYLSGVKTVSRMVVVLAGLLNLVTFIAWRAWKRHIIRRRIVDGKSVRNTLIVGAGKMGRALAEVLNREKDLGYRVRGFLDSNHTGDPGMLGKIEDLSRVARAEFVDDIFITIPSERELVKRVATEARRQHLSVKVVPDLYDGLGWNASLDYVGHFPILEIYTEPIPALGLIAKRIFDVAASGLALTLLAPVMAIVALVIVVDSPGKIFYRSRRVGRKGVRFTCYKFRTMVANADDLKSNLRHLNEREGPFFKITDDPRITPVGRFLRKSSLDELPQLWNVLKGDMSLVGPRPHPVDDFAQYCLDHLRRLDVKPGVTGLWQVMARTDPSFDTNMNLDIEYIENWSFWLDLKILLLTAPEVLRGTGS